LPREPARPETSPPTSCGRSASPLSPHFSGDQTQPSSSAFFSTRQVKLRRPDTLGRLAAFYRAPNLPPSTVPLRSIRITVLAAGRRSAYKVPSDRRTPSPLSRGMHAARRPSDHPVRADRRPLRPSRPSLHDRTGARQRHRPSNRPAHHRDAQLTHLVKHTANGDQKDGLKLVLYGEAQEISAGVYTDTTVNPNVQTALPADSGWLVGTRWRTGPGTETRSCSSVFRHAEGIAAYDPLAVPLTFANDRTDPRIERERSSASRQLRARDFGILVGRLPALLPHGDPSPRPRRSTTRGSWRCARSSTSASVGPSRSRGPSRRSATRARSDTDQPLIASEWRAGIMPYFSPSGRGSYKLPQLRSSTPSLRAINATRELYPAQDVFSRPRRSSFSAWAWSGGSTRPRTREKPHATTAASYAVSLAIACLASFAPGDWLRPGARRCQQPCSPRTCRLARRVIYQVIVDRFFDGDVNNDFNVKSGSVEPIPGGRLARRPGQPRLPPGARRHHAVDLPHRPETSTPTRDIAGYHGYWQQDLTQLNRTWATSPACARWWPPRTTRDEGDPRPRVQSHGAGLLLRHQL